MFPQRPKPVKEEDEDDLLRKQQEFFTLKEAGKIQPSVSKVIKVNPMNEDEKIIKPCDEPKSDGSMTFDVNSLTGIGDLPIVERNVSDFNSFSFPKKVKLPFPKPTRRVEKCPPFSSPLSSSSQENYSKQNEELLAKMTEEQIKEMREEVLSKLKPEHIEFFLNRKKKKQNKVDVKQELSSTKQSNSTEMMETNELSEKNVKDFPISLKVIKESNWLNMDVIEEEKLEWVRPIQTKSNEPSKAKSARFDFTGKLVLDDKSPKEGLHHHGDEPDQPGYTLSEIYTFIQSTFDSQKIMGLKILAKIMDKAHKGYYDLCFNSLLTKECLENTEIIISIRKCLDDTSETVIREAILTLHATICNNLIDEACLDRFFPVTLHYHNFLYLAPNEKEKNIDYNGMKDDQLVKIDIIKALIRFDTLPRLRYLIDNNVKHKEDPTLITKMMEILIRIARHSPQACKSILDCPYLIETIVTNFIPAKIDFTNNLIYGNPFPKALKLLRLIMSETSNCIKIMNTYIHLWDSFQLYLTLDPDCFCEEITSFKRTNILQLSIESLRVWCILLANSEIPVAKNCFNEVYPVVYRQLQYCCTLTSTNHKFDFQYAATLVKCLVFAASEQETLQKGYGSLVQSLLFQAVRDIVDLNIVPPFDTLMMMTTAIEFLVKNNCKTSLLMMNLLNPLADNERVMKILASRLKKCSFVIQSKINLNGCQRDASNLPSFGAIHFAGDQIHFVDLAQDDSVVFFVEGLLAAAEATKSQAMISKIVLNKHIISYFNLIASDHCDVGESVFKQIEFTFIYQVSMSSLKVIINEEQLFYNLSLVSLYHLKDVKMKENLLNLMTFNPVILEKLLPPKVNDDNNDNMLNYETIKAIYFKYSKFDSHLWIFDPIIISYQDKLTETNSLDGSLRFILFILTTNRNLMNRMIRPEVIFGLISTIYLIENRQFAEEPIRKHLSGILKLLIDEKLTISDSYAKLPHISTYLNFFDIFMKQFESESFGDPLFINYLLIFLQPSSSQDFLKKLLSDYSVATRFITLDPDNLLIPLKRLFYPVINDLSVIELLLSSLLCNHIVLNRKSLLYLIALHHTHNSLFKVTYGSKEDCDRLKRCLLSIDKCKNSTLKAHLTKFMESDLVDSCDWAEHYCKLSQDCK